jgi:hypothetical protein
VTKFVNTSLSCGRHDPWQILRIREEGKDTGDREGNPVGELKAVKHDWGQMATRQGCGHQFLVTTLRLNAARRSGTAYISTGKGAADAECKKNRSERLAKESRA